MTLPISVVIPCSESRKEWFHKYCLPSVYKQNPAEVIIMDGPGGANPKRNAGAKKATAPYLIFIDDDHVLRPGALECMMRALEENPGSFAYSDVEMVGYIGIPCPNGPGTWRSRPWSYELLKKGNYIDMPSLMRRDAFYGFDENIKRFQDWDLWLRMARNGHQGIYIPEVLVESHHMDHGISATVDWNEALTYIRRKHGFDDSIAFIVPTIGRVSLLVAIESIISQKRPDDLIIVVGDGPQPHAREMVGRHPYSGHVAYTELPYRANDWGGMPRNEGIRAASRHAYLAFMDDDDRYLEGAVAAMRAAIQETPGKPVIFRMLYRGNPIWREPEIRIGNVSTQMFLVPNLPGRIGRWSSRMEGDFDFILDTSRLHGGDVVWRKEVISRLDYSGKGV